jgi:hypothetical protein
MRCKINPGLLILIFSVTACASPSNGTSSNDALSQQTSDEECYCSVRKQQQVKARLKKKKELESE